LGLAIYPGLGCAVVEQLLSEAAPVVIASAEEFTEFRLRPLFLWGESTLQ
jgi:hypothetical protein